MILIDGLDFDEVNREGLDELKRLAEKLSMPIWFTMTTHRHEEPDQEGLPIQLSRVQDLFPVAIALQPDQETIHIKVIKGRPDQEISATLTLDPATMLIRSQD